MAYFLSDIAIITGGLVAPVGGGAYCLAPFPLITHGRVVLELPALGMADPWSRPSRFTQPFDRGYYEWRYGKPKPKTPPELSAPPEKPPQISEVLDLDGPRMERARILRARAADRTRLNQIQATNAQTELDIIGLESYIEQIIRSIETGLAEQLAGQLQEEREQAAMIERLEQNVVAAREALFLAIDTLRRHQNQMVAIQAAIRMFF